MSSDPPYTDVNARSPTEPCEAFSDIYESDIHIFLFKLCESNLRILL